jgi:hypothetical protein
MGRGAFYTGCARDAIANGQELRTKRIERAELAVFGRIKCLLNPDFPNYKNEFASLHVRSTATKIPHGHSKNLMISSHKLPILAGCISIFCGVLLGSFSLSASGEEKAALVHGLWVWKSAQVLEGEHGSENLRDFCKSQGINEVYVSVSAQSEASEDNHLAHLTGYFIGRISVWKRCFRARMPTSQASIGKNCWSMSGESCDSIKGIRRNDLTRFIWTWNRNNARRIKGPET